MNITGTEAMGVALIALPMIVVFGLMWHVVGLWETLGLLAAASLMGGTFFLGQYLLTGSWS